MTSTDTSRCHPASDRGFISAPFVIASAAFLVVMSGTTLPTPLYPLYQAAANFPAFVLTVIFAVYAAGVIAALLIAGPWSDQLGRKPMLLGAMVFAFLSDILFMQGASLWTILPGRMLSGLSAGVFASTATVAVMELAPDRCQSKASLVATGSNIVGLGCGPILSGILASFVSNPLLTPFVVHACAITVLFIALLTVVPETAKTEGKPKLSIRRLSIPGTARPIFVPAAIAAFAAFMLAGFVTSVGSSYLSQDLGVRSHAVVGLVAGLLFLASAVGQMGDSLLPKDSRLIVGASTLFIGLAVLLVALIFNSLLLLITGIAIGGLGFGVAFHSGLSGVTQASPNERKAEAVATYFTVSYVAISLPVLAIGAVQTFAGLRPTAIGFDAIAVLVVAVAVFQLRRLSANRH